MKRFASCILVFTTMGLVGAAWAGQDKPEPQLRLELDLTDGSRVIGTPGIDELSVQTSYARMDIPLHQILAIKMGEDHETAAFDLRNGDKIKGVLTLAPVKLKTVFGKVAIGVEHIKALRVTIGGGALPAGEGTMAFGGVNWTPWRTAFEVRGDKLVSLPKARPGFNYGHGGSGRGPTIMSNIGSAEWKNYSMEVEFCMRGVDAAFNPHGLPLDYRGGSILFHVADAKESWNERGSTWYTLSLGADGAWSLGCAYNFHCRVSCGWGNPFSEGNRSLAEGRGLRISPTDGNKVRIDVSGTRIRVWVDGEQLADVRDEKMGEVIGEKKLDHGGVGFQWGHDCMGWIRNFTVRQL